MTGLFQVGLTMLIWVLLLPSTRKIIVPPRGGADDVPALFSSADPRVRALAAEVAGYRAGGTRYASGLIDRLDDADGRVRTRAHESLTRLAGTDASPGEEGRATSALQLCDVLGQALGTGVAGAIMAAATAGIGHGPGVALAFSFALAAALAGVIAGRRLPSRLTSSSPARESAGT